MSFLTFGRLTGVRILGVVILLAAAGPVVAQPNLNRSRQFPPGALKRIEDLPLGRVRTRMERLNPAARQRALDSLQHFHFTEMDLDSLQVDDDGGVYYADISHWNRPGGSGATRGRGGGGGPFLPFRRV